MATWTPRNAMRGIAVSRWGRPPPPPYLSPEYPSSETPPSTPPDSDLEEYPESPYPIDSDMPIPTSPMEEPEVYDWLEDQLSTTGEMSVVERLRHLLDTGQFADVNIRVGQGNNVTVFKAHRLLLATASQPLYRLVYSVNPSPGPKDITTIRVTDMKASDFEYILKYIYTDSIDCSNINVAFELLKASKKWGLAGLGIKSLNYLEEFLDEYQPSSEDMKTNLFDLLVLSEQSLNDMYEKCWQVLVKFCNEVIPCEGFLNLDKPLLTKIINHADLKFTNHLNLFVAIRDWGLRYVNLKNMKISQLGDVVEDLINIIDFEKIEDNDFVNTVLTSECLGKAEVIAFFMTRGLEIPRNLDFNNNKQLPFWIWFCATSEMEEKEKTSSRKDLFNMSTVNENSPTISLKNGTSSAFNKVCRFRKGYRCPQEEIYLPHELRFRVNKNIKLVGVGFGFLFSCTDMGITIHCQGPWETRQWSDIIQTYCRVSGEKQETADVRLMFAEPVRIAANQSYKVMVKIGRMSSGSSEVELWGGTGGQYTVTADDEDFFFVKAAVDPNTKVEEGDGDINPGIITELLYQADTDDHSKDDVKTEIMTRRRRPQPEEEEEGNSQQTSSESSPWRKRHRAADLSLQIPDTTRIRRRGDGNDSIVYTPKRSPVEEYKPMSFSTNRWRTKTKEEDSDKTTKVEEYKPSSFSTNRWKPKPQDDYSPSTNKVTEDYMPSSFSTNRWRTRTQEDSTAIANKAAEELKPSSFATNRWRTTSREENSDTKTTLDTSPYGSRKTSAEEKPESYSTSRFRTRSREEAPPPKVELRKTIGVDDDKSSSSLPFMRRRESGENKPTELSYLRRRESTETKVPEMPAYLRKRANPVEDNKAATPFGRSRFGSSTTTPTTNSDDSKPRDTTTRSRFLHNNDTSLSSSRPSDSYTLRTRDSSASRYSTSKDTPSTSSASRYSTSRDTPSTRTQDSSSLSRMSDNSLSRTRDPSVSRTRDSSLSRFRDSSSTSRYGPSSTSSYGSSYMSRYDSSAGGGTDTSPTGISNRYGSSTSTGSTQRRYAGAGSDSTLYRSRYGSSLTSGGSDLGTSNRYSSTDSTGTNNVSSNNKYGSSISSGLKDLGSSNRYGSSSYMRPSDSGSSSRYSNPASTGSTDAGSSSRYSRHSSPFSTRDNNSTSKSSKYGSSSVLSPTSTTHDSSSSKWAASNSTSKYGNDLSPSSKYGSTSISSNKYSNDLSPSSKYGSTRSSSSKYGNDLSPSSKYGSTSSSSSKYGNDLSPSSKYGNDLSPSSKYGNDLSPSNKYGSTSSKYGTSSSRY